MDINLVGGLVLTVTGIYTVMVVGFYALMTS